MKRISALDGWRGVAILLVLVDHLQAYSIGHFVAPWTHTGMHGVTIFFVLSGYLITSKLIEDQVQNGVSLKTFYVRRFFRLMPAAWLYLGFAFAFSHLSGANFLAAGELPACVLFYRNFLVTPGSATGHFWTLSIEEQFYLVWPALLILAGIKRARWIAGAGVLGCAMYRFSLGPKASQYPWWPFTQLHADALLVGCLLAILISDPKRREQAAKYSDYLIFPAIVTMFVCILRNHTAIPVWENIAIASLVCSAVLNQDSVLNSLIANPALAWIGRISYSLYLWQQVFMVLGNPWILTIGLPLFSMGSYYLIEKPGIRLGNAIVKRWTAERDVYEVVNSSLL